MSFSAKTEYACLAMLELALRYSSGDPVCLRNLAEVHQIPSQFLVQILLQLKRSGLVHSTRGTHGGYRLAKDPDEISMLSIVDAVEGERTRLGQGRVDRSVIGRVLADVWQSVDDAQRQLLTETTLGQLMLRSQSVDAMYYI
jgi:Rrf2 family protein